MAGPLLSHSCAHISRKVAHFVKCIYLFVFAFLGYVDNIRKLLLSLTKEEMDATRLSYKDTIPEPLNRQFTDRTSKHDALNNYQERQEKVKTLFPEGKVCNLCH